MDFSEDKQNNIIDNLKQDIEESGYKKYVVSISNEFVPLVDAMSVERRNELINEIISLHNDEINEKIQIKHSIKVTVFTIIIVISLLFAAPLILWLANQSYILTKNNYNEMQNNFEVLYHK